MTTAKGHVRVWRALIYLDLFIFYLGFKGRDGVPPMVKAYLDKKFDLDEFITHNMTLDQINDGIELMKHGKWSVYLPIFSPFMIR